MYDEEKNILVELYSLKYENTKLNELREVLKSIENYNAKLKLNKIDLRQDYEISKKENNEKIAMKKKLIEEKTKDLNIKENELIKKIQELNDKKNENKKKIENLNLKFEKLKKEKEEAIQFNKQIKIDTENMQNDFTKKIVQLNDNIEHDKKNFEEINKQIRDLELKIDEVDEKISEFEKVNPELVNKIKEEERKFLIEQENKKVLFGKIINEKNGNKTEEKLNFIGEKKEDEKNGEKKENEKKDEKKENNKRFTRKKSKKFGK